MFVSSLFWNAISNFSHRLEKYGRVIALENKEVKEKRERFDPIDQLILSFWLSNGNKCL